MKGWTNLSCNLVLLVHAVDFDIEFLAVSEVRYNYCIFFQFFAGASIASKVPKVVMMELGTFSAGSFVAL